MSKAREPSIRAVIKSLGLQNQRARTLKRLARAVASEGITKENVSSLPGVGPYARDAYMILFHGQKTVLSKDYALRNLVRYRNEGFKKCPECKTDLRLLYYGKLFHTCTECRWMSAPYWYGFK